MRHGMQGHVAEPREPTRHLGGAEEARMRGRGHVASEGAGRCRAQGLVGPGYIVGEVTQMR